MFEARFNGENIRPDDYKEDIHKGNLCCPDPACTATVTHRKKSENTDGGQGSREAHFATMPNQKHVKGCEVKKYEASCHRAITSLGKGGFVVFNLNMIPKRVTSKFNEKARRNLVPGIIECKKDWVSSHRQLYASVAIHHTGDLIPILEKIEEKHGKEALNRCMFNSGGYIIPHNEFDLRDQPEKVENLFKSLFHKEKGAVVYKVRSNPNWVFGAPRLITVTNTRSAGYNLQGAPQKITTNKNDRDLFPIIKPKSPDQTLTRSNLIKEQDCTLIAQPHINIEEEKKRYKRGQGFQMGWSLHTDKQFVLSDRPEPKKPAPTEQKSFNFS